jgi:hypothetical protein
VPKKIDYYAVNEPYKIPKWLGATLGGVFALVAVGAAAIIIHLSRPTQAAAAPAPAVAAVAAAPEAVAPVETPPPAPPAANVQVAHKSHHSAKATKAAKPIRKDKANAILAKHDSREKRKAKNDLDRLLGL